MVIQAQQDLKVNMVKWLAPMASKVMITKSLDVSYEAISLKADEELMVNMV